MEFGKAPIPANRRKIVQFVDYRITESDTKQLVHPLLGVMNELRGDRGDFAAFAVIFGDVQNERLAVNDERRRDPQLATHQKAVGFELRRFEI